MTNAQQFLVLLGMSLWLVVSSAVRLWLRRRRSLASENVESLINPITLIFHLTGTIAMPLALLLGAGLFRQGLPFLGIRLLALGLLVSGISGIAADRFWPSIKPQRFWLPVLQALCIASLGVGILGFALFLRSIPGPNGDALRVDWPIEGRWKVMAGGRHHLTNHHHTGDGVQSLAVDFVLDAQRGASLGRPISSPVSGVVLQAIGNRYQGSASAEGNVVKIETDEGITVTLAHLQTGSLIVSTDDEVTAGQQIASCGDSGSATVAHLHVHAERFGRPVPILFGPGREFPLRFDVIESDR